MADGGDRPGAHPTLDELQRALDESEQRYRNLFENSVLGIYRTTPDGRVLLANPALLRMLGYASLEDLTHRDLEHGDFEPRYSRARFKEKIEAAGEIIGLESVWVKRDGTALFVRENARVIRTADGIPLYYEGTVEDISERKRAEEKLRALLSELSRVAERDRLRSAGRVAEYASGALGEALVLLDRAGDGAAELAEARGLVERAARCAQIVRAELDPPRLDEVTLEQALGSLVELQREVGGLRFEFVDDGRPKPLDEDLGYLLLTAARELLLNAIQHSGAARCRLSVSKDGSNARVVVEDDGVGFDPALLDRGPRSGLVRMRERLETAGGGVEIRSAGGRGARVALYAPLSLAC